MFYEFFIVLEHLREFINSRDTHEMTCITISGNGCVISISLKKQTTALLLFQNSRLACLSPYTFSLATSKRLIRLGSQDDIVIYLLYRYCLKLNQILRHEVKFHCF